MQTATTQSWNLTEPEIMEITGRLDSGTAPSMEEDGRTRIQSGARELVLDCGKLHSVTAAGLRAILALARDMRAMRGQFAVCNLQPQVKEMFEACSFDQIIPVYDNQDEAVTKLAA